MLTVQRLERRACRGATLIELVVAMAIGGVVIALVSMTAVRQQRFYSAFSEISAVAGQLGETGAILPIDIRAISSAAGDIRPREARDTSLEFRATIATAVICDTTATNVILAPAVPGAGTAAAFGASPQAGDSAWIYTVVDTVDDWKAYRIAAVSSTKGGSCLPGAPMVSGSARSISRTTLALEPRVAGAGLVGMPVRITRPLRYSLYRASDGMWFLGRRDWNDATQRFNTIQPVAGPFLSASSGGVAFRYADSAGATVPPGSVDTYRIALVQMVLRSQTPHAVRVPGLAVGANGRRADSLAITVFIRNRR